MGHCYASRLHGVVLVVVELPDFLVVEVCHVATQMHCPADIDQIYIVTYNHK